MLHPAALFHPTDLAASTRDNDGSVIRSLILPTFGAASLSAIEPGHIRTWVAELVAAGYAPSTIRRAADSAPIRRPSLDL